MRIGKIHSISGFTLAEMLVVLALISLIAGIATPVVSGAIVRAKEAALREELHVLRKAIDDYDSLNGVYPGDLHELVDARLVRAFLVVLFFVLCVSWVFVFVVVVSG